MLTVLVLAYGVALGYALRGARRQLRHVRRIYR
jgi:hypothetical protein